MDAMDGQLVWREVFEKRSRPVCGPHPPLWVLELFLLGLTMEIHP